MNVSEITAMEEKKGTEWELPCEIYIFQEEDVSVFLFEAVESWKGGRRKYVDCGRMAERLYVGHDIRNRNLRGPLRDLQVPISSFMDL